MLSVNPHTHIGCGRTYMKEDVLAIPRVVQTECPAILSRMVTLHRNKRRVVLIPCPPRITYIQIQRDIISVELPHSGNRHGIPSCRIIIGLEEVHITRIQGLIPLEIPYSVQSQPVTTRIKCGGHRIPVDFHNARILPMGKFCCHKGALGE